MVFDVVTPTARERREADLAARKRRYAVLMGLCVALLLFGFFLSAAPVPLRLAALVVAAVLPPVAAVTANRPPSG